MSFTSKRICEEEISSVLDEMCNLNLGNERRRIKRKAANQEQEDGTCAIQFLKKKRVEPIFELSNNVRTIWGEKIFEQNTNNILETILEFLPPEENISLIAQTNKAFCGAYYALYRKNSKSASFLRQWKVTTDSVFDPSIHFHPQLLDHHENKGHIIPKVQIVITFATDISASIFSSVLLPSCAMLGSTDLVVAAHGLNNYVSICEENVCISSLFIPESKNFVLHKFLIAEDNPCSQRSFYPNNMTKDSLKFLKAVFFLQYDIANSVDISGYVSRNFGNALQCGGITNVENNNVAGSCTTDAVGFSIFTDEYASVKLYGFDMNNYGDIFMKIQEDIKGRENGFCVFLFNSKQFSIAKVESWEEEDDSSEEVVISVSYNKPKENIVKILDTFQAYFPKIPVVGGNTPHIIFHNGENHNGCQSNAAFLILTY